MSRPRILRSSASERPRRSRPSKIACPLVTRPARGRMPRIASEVTLLPQPDSPTMPSVSPGATSNETPLTACTVPRWVQNCTRRSFTDSRLKSASPQLGVERLAQRVADQVEPERRHDDRAAGNDREERRGLKVRVRLGEHCAPLRPRRFLVAEAELA